MAQKKIFEIPSSPGFKDALGAYMFFTKRYVVVFYSVLAFAAFFAVLISLVSIVLTILHLFASGGEGSGGKFTLMVLIFFAIGFQALMAFASIAYNLWSLVFQDHDPKREFPSTQLRVKMLRIYYDTNSNFIFKTLSFLLPTLATSFILVVPLFVVLLGLVNWVDLGVATPTLLQEIFFFDFILVGLSVFLMNYNYYLETRVVKTT